MTHVLSLGAINKQTDEYVSPKIANKKDEYSCPDCNKDLILCQGKIIRPYFRHKIDSVNPCHHYSNPTETQIHKDAKMLIKMLLDKKIPLLFSRNCITCKKKEEFEIPEISETSTIKLEHSFKYKGIKQADVAYLDAGEIVCLFEICNTHKTSSENRPEPWFEIDAETFIKLANDNSLSQIKIPCIRCEKCDDCMEKELDRKRKIRNEVERKSHENESNSYCCYSEPIMEILIDIICGDDAYKKWSDICREMYPTKFDADWSNVIDWEYARSDMEKNIKVGYNNGNCRDTYYNEDLIRDIQNIHLYKYLKELYVDKGQPRFTFDCCYVRQNDKDDIEDKLIILCEKLFGLDDTKVTWEFEKESKNNDCCHCNGTGYFVGNKCWFC